jgi:hypothetical protein
MQNFNFNYERRSPPNMDVPNTKDGTYGQADSFKAKFVWTKKREME